MVLKSLLFRLLAVSLPLLLLLALEAGLRLAGVAADRRIPFQEIPGRPDHLALSPDYVQRYFTGFLPGVAFTPFRAQQDDATFRVVTMGGSSTAGFPYHFYYGFPARLLARLETYAPGRRIEVVNLGLTAVNSYTLWDLKDAVAAQQPDAVLIYAGHNEYYGAFGAGSTIYALGNRIWLKRLTLRLKRTVLFTLLERLVRGAPRGDDPNQASRTMMARVVRDAGIEKGGPVFEAGVAQFEANLGDVLGTFRDAGIPVYVATLTANLKDQPPLGGDAGADRAYRRGLDLLAGGDTTAARAAFLEAKEHDDVRFRAPEVLNERIRVLAATPGVTLVDVQALFQAHSPRGIEGNALFTDHLHPTYQGYDLMAGAFFEALRAHPRLRLDPGMPYTDSAYVLDPFEQVHAALQIERLTGGYPFNKTVTPEEEERAYRTLLDRVFRSGHYPDSLAVRTLTSPLSVQEALFEGVKIARSRADTLTALLLYRALLQWQPFNESLMKTAVGYAAGSPRYDPVVADLARFSANRTRDVYHLNVLAAVRLRQGRRAEAAALLDAVETRDPTSRAMLFNKARLLVLEGDTAAARRYFERYRAAE